MVPMMQGKFSKLLSLGLIALATVVGFQNCSAFKTLKAGRSPSYSGSKRFASSPSSAVASGIPMAATQIVAQVSLKCLDNANQGDPSPLTQWECSGAQNPNWQFVPQGNGTYQIVSVVSGKCLDITDASTSNGALAQIYDCRGAQQLNQIFTLVPDGNNFKIVAQHSGKCLDVPIDHGGEGTYNGLVLQQWDCFAGSSNQDFGWDNSLPTSVSVTSAPTAAATVFYDNQWDASSPCVPLPDVAVNPISSIDSEGLKVQFVVQSYPQPVPALQGNYFVSAHYQGTTQTQTYGVDCGNAPILHPIQSPTEYVVGDEWLMSLYKTANGIFGLIHNEYYGGSYDSNIPANCSADGNDNCWLSWVGAAKLNPSTGTFKREGGRPAENIIARPTWDYTFGAPNGYIWNTNIVLNQRDGYYYTYLSLLDLSPMQGSTANPWHFCPARTQDISDPHSWRAWDGNAFTVDTTSGGNCVTPSDLDQRADPGAWIFHISFNTYFQQFIAVTNVWVVDHDELGFVLSPDLIHWTTGQSFGVPSVGPDSSNMNYPSLIDVVALGDQNDTNSMSGAVTGRTPMLLYNIFGSAQDPDADHRKIWSVPIVFSMPAL